MMRQKPEPGDIWAHFKGNMYQICAIATHTETGELLVIYHKVNGIDLYARPYDMFMSEVDRKKYPDVKTKYRFTFVKKGDIDGNSEFS